MLTGPLDFLRDLSVNNNRPWFEKNRERYRKTFAEFENFIDNLISVIRGIDPFVDVISAKECVFRIYRDARFSKDKSPYKTNFGAYICRGGRKSPFAGYYFHIEPGGSFAGGGIYRPDPQTLNAVRQLVDRDGAELQRIIDEKSFRLQFSGIYGETLKTAPAGYSREHPFIDILRYKDFAVTHPLSDAEVSSDDLISRLESVFRAQLSFNAFLNRAVMRSPE